jgi:hypothetical protein
MTFQNILLLLSSGRPPLWSSGQSSWLQNGDVLFPVRYELNLYMLCRRKHRLCGLVVRVLGYRSGGLGSIPGTNRKKKKISGSGTGCTQPREYKLRSYLIEK